MTEEKKQQVIALGRLGWSLRRIQRNTGVRRETAATYLKAAGIAFRQPGGWGRHPPAKPANGVITDSEVHDGQSWRSYMPIQGRTDYPMLFDRHCKPKPALDAVVAVVRNKK